RNGTMMKRAATMISQMLEGRRRCAGMTTPDSLPLGCTRSFCIDQKCPQITQITGIKEKRRRRIVFLIAAHRGSFTQRRQDAKGRKVQKWGFEFNPRESV